MKNERMIIPFMISLFLFTTVPADNPIIQTIYTADPAPVVHDERVYVYTSHDEDVLEDNFFTMKEWKCYSSSDMVNWTDHGTAASLKSFNWTSNNGAWAPQGIYRNGNFYLYCPIHMKGIGVLVSDNPWGPFTDPLGKPLISGGSGDIDPTVFIDDDEQAYLYWGNPYLKYVKLNQNMVSYSGKIEEINLTVESFGRRSDTERATSYEEGPWLYKRNNLYYMVFAGGPISEHIAYSTSSSPTGPWTYRGVIMPTQGGSFTNHAGVIDFKGKSYFFYHNAALPGGGGFNRSVCVEQFSYNEDGTFPTINMSNNGPPPATNLDPYDTIQAETICWESGIETAPCSEGSMMVTSISNGDYIKVKSVDFGDGASSFEVRAASGSSGGSIELRLGSQTGTLVGTCNITGTGGWDIWQNFQCDISDCTGIKDMFLVFKGSGEPFRLNWYMFDGGSGYRLSVQTSGLGTVTRSPSGSRYSEDTPVTLTAVPEEGWEFIGWSGEDLSGNQNPASIVMDNDKAVTALFSRSTVDGNLVFNGDFSSGSDNWTLNVWSGSATGSVIDGEYNISIESDGTNNHDIQLVQPELFLENGKTYVVTFDAYAVSNRSLEANVEMADEPWTSYLQELQSFNLTDVKQTFTFKFTMEELTNVNGRLGFNVGIGKPSVFIDNVSVKIFDPTETVFRKRIKGSSEIKARIRYSVLSLESPVHLSGKYILKVYSMKGQLVKTASLMRKSENGFSGSVDLSQISHGYYIVRVENGKKILHSLKMVLAE
ncbi:MAG: family 43 glycosylhydrolase [Fibrobacter sp.]|nr:family 43 glycosylhydrolase [Fibrobacter sp.]